ncbi:hypothetical protein [Amycolatopsis sp. NPDC001319]|uniref:hypothetical protein n=1 Tax=unclassified Amycolatopsis TaxID=2618356 RepID=UPI003681F0CB
MSAVANEMPGGRPVGRYEWERIVRRAQMPKQVKYVAFVMATYADADGSRVRPGLDVLAAVTGEGMSTVRRRIAELRDTYGLIGLVSRGGGRAGRGKAAEYRLVLPLDLLDRVELLPPGDAARRGSAADSPLTQVDGQSSVGNPESPLTQASAQSDVSPVDNSDSPLTLVSSQSDVDTAIDRSNNDVSEGLTAQKPRLSAHPGGQLPATTPTTTDQHPGPDPTQPPTAREPEPTPATLRPRRCPHGLPNHRRPDGTPSCAACRRGLPAGHETGDPP